MISLLAAAKATLRVIGLATVMQGDPGIDVVMPPVSQSHHIEKHVPVLIVRDNELKGSTDGWTTKPYGDEYTIVYLTGEDVEFLPDAGNPVSEVPSQLPRLTNKCRRIGAPPKPVGLAVADNRPEGPAGPPAEEPSRPPLHLGYRRPLYTSAVAVLRVPYGSSTACRAVVKTEEGKQQRDRIDTRVRWDTEGGVTIVGKHRKKHLRFEGSNVLIVAGNVPEYLLSPDAEVLRDAGHFKVYYNMLHVMGRQGCARQEPAEELPSCDVATIRNVALGGRGLPPTDPPRGPELIRILTSECSNSQYP